MSSMGEGKQQSDAGQKELQGAKGLTWRTVFLTFLFGTLFSVATIYTLVVLSFSMGIVAGVSIVLTSSGAILGMNSAMKNKVKPLSSQELVGMNWLSSALNQSFGTSIVISGVLIMRYILPLSSFPTWQRWWFAPAEGELGNIVAWIPTILFWMLVVFLARITVIGIGLRLKPRFIDTDELPFPVGEAQADMIKELTAASEPPISKLRYFLSGIIFALVFSLVFEHNWDYPLLAPMLATVIGFSVLAGAVNNAFPWKISKKLPKGLEKVAYYFGYFFLFIGILGLVSCFYAPPNSFLFYLRNGFALDPFLSSFYSSHPDYAVRFIDFSYLIPQLGGLGFGASISILVFVIGYLIPADSSSGILVGSLLTFVLIPVALFLSTGSINKASLYGIDTSIVLAAILCATIVGSAVTIVRTIIANKTGAKLVILKGAKELYGLSGTKRRSKRRLDKAALFPLLLTWIPLILLALTTILVIGIEPGEPWYLSIIIVFFAAVITPLATTLGTWIASRTTRITSQSPLPFLYEATLAGTGVRELSPYAFGAPTIWQAPGILSQLRVARLTKTESRVVYWADLIGFPILGVLLSSLLCIWVFSSLGTPGALLSPPGGDIGTTTPTQWNFAPIWSALYAFIVWIAGGGGAFPFQAEPIIFFLLPLGLLAAWTILHSLKRIPIASIAGLLVGFAVLPYIAITISFGALTAIIVRRLKGTEWFSRYGTTLGAGIYAGASISLFLLVVITPLIP